VTKVPDDRVSSVRASLQKLRPLWLSTWPLLALVLLACVAAARWVPAGYARAMVAAPILLMVPGSLTLGAVFGGDSRLRAVAFTCYSVLLSAIWFGFASLALYLLGVQITTDRMYWSLLVICAALAAIAQTRPERRQPKASLLAAGSECLNPDPPGPQGLAAPFYIIGAVAAGLSLLAGAVYVQARLSHPAPAGYTWMAWEHPRGKNDFTIGHAGTKLPFTIARRQAGLTKFRLSAAWQGRPSGSLAKPMALTLSPNQTFHAALFVPSLPHGCIYRVVITLTATRQLDPFSRRPQSWSINALVHAPGVPRKMCN
jgi:hypothetical protein